MTTVAAVHGTAGTTAFRTASARTDTAGVDMEMIRVGGSHRVNAAARNGTKLVHAPWCGREECPSQISVLLRYDPRKTRENHERGRYRVAAAGPGAQGSELTFDGLLAFLALGGDAGVQGGAHGKVTLG